MRAGLFTTPRPEPGHLVPALAAALVLAVALAVFIVASWPLAGWLLAVVLWLAAHALDVLLARARTRAGNLAAASVQAVGLLFKALALLVVLVAVAVSHPHVAVAAAVTYALAYTLELGLSLAGYFGGAR
jgi:hypothetical protein